MARNKKNQNTAAILALLGGAIGLHWFYLRKTFLGLFYIFLLVKFADTTFFGLPVVILISLINAVKFFNMDPDRFDRKYNRSWLKRQKAKRRYPSPTEPTSAKKQKTRRPKIKKSSSKRKSTVNKYLKQAKAAYDKMDLLEAEKGFLKAMSADSSNADAPYYLACIYSVWEDKDRAFEYLERAVKNGLKQVTKISNEEKLAFLRIQEEYQEFVDNNYRRISPQELPKEEHSYVEQLLKLKALREQGKIEETVYRKEVDKLKNNYGN